MARAMTEREKREIMHIVVTDRREGTIVTRKRVRARDYSRKDNYHRGVRRAMLRIKRQYPNTLYSIQMYHASSMHPLAHWA